MNPRHGIIAGGNWIVDHVKLIDTWPPQDALANILTESVGNGGSPYNILKNLAKLGATFPLEAIGLVGDDPDGRHILQDCRVHKIITRQLGQTQAAATSYTDVMTVREGGRRTFFHQRGANALLGEEHFDFRATEARHFHLGYALLLDRLDQLGPKGLPGLAEVLRAARAAGLTTSLDCVSENSNRFRDIVVPALPEVDVLFVNDFEAEKLTGLLLGRGERVDPAAVHQAARALLTLGVRGWAVIHFPEAACACARTGQVLWQPSVQVPAESVAGTAGAGDAFAAGVLHGLHESWPMEASLELGACTAAASLLHPTCSEGIVNLSGCLALKTRWGLRSLAYKP